MRKHYKEGELSINLLDAERSSYEQFPEIAEQIIHQFKGTVVNKYDVFDSRWWEMIIKGQKITLRHHDMVGLTVSPTDKADANSVVEEIALYLEKDWITNN